MILRELCQKLGQEIPTLSVIEQKKQTHFVSLIEDYYDGIKTHLLEEHRILKKMEKQNRSIYAQRGELHEERRMALIEQKDKTDGFKKIADEIMHELGLGLTVFLGRGGFSGERCDVLFLMAERLQLAEIKALVHRIDPSAFIAIENLHEVAANSLKEISNKKPTRSSRRKKSN